MPKGARLNLRLDASLEKSIKAYAKRHHTTVSALIDRHLRQLLAQEEQHTTVMETGDAPQV